MFVELFLNRLEKSFERALARTSSTAFAAAALTVSLGFTTAAAYSWLKEAFSEQAALSILAGAYGILSILIYHAAKWLEQRRAKAAVVRLATPPMADPLREALDRFGLPTLQTDVLRLLEKSDGTAARIVREKALGNIHLVIGASLGIFIASRLADVLTTNKKLADR